MEDRERKLREYLEAKYSDNARKEILDQNKEDASGINWKAGISGLGAALSGRGNVSSVVSSIADQQEKSRDRKLSQFDSGKKQAVEEYLMAKNDNRYNQEQETANQRYAESQAFKDKQFDADQVYKQQSLDFKKQQEAKKTKTAFGKVLTEGQKAVDKDYAKEYNKFTASGMNNAANTIDKLSTLQKEIAADTGFGEAGGTRFPIPDMLRSRKAIERRDDARNFANKTLKELFGGQLSDAEREAAAREYWNDSLDNESNAKRLDGKIKELRDNLEIQTRKAKYYEKHGTLQDFSSTSSDQKTITKKQYSSKANKTKITYSDGSEEILDGRQ